MILSGIDVVFCNCKVVFLATKPQYFPKVVAELYTGTIGLPLNILISVMAGISLDTLQKVRNSDRNKLFIFIVLSFVLNITEIVHIIFSLFIIISYMYNKKIYSYIMLAKWLRTNFVVNNSFSI